MIDRSLAQPTRSVPEETSPRFLRGIALYVGRGDEIARRADRLNDARTIVIDAPDSEFRNEEQRRRILEVLTEVHDAVNEEHSRYKEALGL